MIVYNEKKNLLKITIPISAVEELEKLPRRRFRGSKAN